MKTIREETISLSTGDPIRYLTPSLYTNDYGHVAEYTLLTVRAGEINYAYGENGVSPLDTGHRVTKGQTIGIEGSYVLPHFRFKAVKNNTVVFVTYENTVAFTAVQHPET